MADYAALTHFLSVAKSCSSFSIFSSIDLSLAFLFRVSLKNLIRSTPLWSVNCSNELSARRLFKQVTNKRINHSFL